MATVCTMQYTQVPGDTEGDAPCDGSHGTSDCPYNFYRTSHDITNTWESFFSNLQTTVPFLSLTNPRSRPGSWAYPDMLEVGRLASAEEDRAHFGAWIVISAPLILGHDPTQKDETDAIWEIISNRELLAVSQSWNGHPGTLLRSWDPREANHFHREQEDKKENDEKEKDIVLQLWGKPMAKGAYAAFVINNHATKSFPVTIDLNLFSSFLSSSPSSPTTYSVRSLYDHKELGTASGNFTSPSPIAPHDSLFYLFTPYPSSSLETASPR